MTHVPNTFFPKALFRAFLFAAIALSLAMAVLSTTTKQVHHDEYDHVNAAQYYTTHWLPPAVGDPRTLDAYSIYGASYLNEWDIVYPLAGKFAALINPFIDNLVLSLRLFNVTLFLLLGCVALLARNAVLSYAVLLTSPQIWYVFSYFNGDAFALFVSFLIVAILATPDDALSHGPRRTLGRFLLLGICIGLLVLSKKTFWAFGLFAAGLAAWLELYRCRRDKDLGGFLRNMTFLAAIIFMTAAPRIAYDVYINGSPAQKQAKIVEVEEALAAPIFKPSVASKASFNLRGKGVGLLDVMKPPFNWARHSFFTMFGSYNYNTIQASPRFYIVILGAYGLFLVYLTTVVSMRADTHDRVILCGAIVTGAFVISLSVYHSWTSDFQPQGRYLFAIFGLVAIVIARNRNCLSTMVVNLFLISSFLLSVHSFAKDGLVSIPHFEDLLEISREFHRPG